jgi:hypothetical protein
VGFQAAIVRVLLKASLTRGGLVQAKICDLSTAWPFTSAVDTVDFCQSDFLSVARGWRRARVEITRARRDKTKGAPKPMLCNFAHSIFCTAPLVGGRPRLRSTERSPRSWASLTSNRSADEKCERLK